MNGKTGYLDIIGGASGDMLLAAMVGAGLDLAALTRELHRCEPRGYAITSEAASRGAVSATLVHVRLSADAPRFEKWQDIESVISASTLPAPDITRALAVLATLRQAEAAAHGSEDSHLHELGTVDTLVDVVGSVIGLRLLGIESLYASPLPVGTGVARSSHGITAATAPATRHIILTRKIPVRSGGRGFPPGEAVTPTGAAIIATLARFTPVTIAPETVAYGAGQRDTGDFPNVLGLWVGSSEPPAKPPTIPGAATTHANPALRTGLTLLETNIDDMPAEALGFVQERLLASGALDVWFTPIQMKKNRPGVLLSVIVNDLAADNAAALVLKETTTLGIRTRPVQRYEAVRETREVETSLGRVPVKLKLIDGIVTDASPEYDHCREIALRTGLPLQEVMRRVQAEALGAVTRGP
jgi:hypothetical protein